MMSTKIKNTLHTVVFISALSFVSMASASSDGVERSRQPLGVQAGDSFGHIKELTPQDFKPAFSRKTVIKLNAIVERSYTVIGEFDVLSNSIERSVDNSQKVQWSGRQLADASRLSAQSKSALNDMNAAVEALQSSAEEYNSAVLAGMVKFVHRVDREVNALLLEAR